MAVVATFVRESGELRARALAWQALAERALEPNPFYEPWFLIPALRELPELGGGTGVLFVEDRGELIGVVPLRVVPLRLRGRLPLPLRRAQVLTHKYSFCHTPLLDRARAADAWRAVLAWCRAEGAPILELEHAYADGPVHELILEVAATLGQASFVRASYERAFFLPRADVETYLAEAMSLKRRREIERRERKLAAAGRLELLESGWIAGGSASPYIEAFLELEASGWKGQEGTAFASAPADRRFFEEAMLGGHRAGRVWFQNVVLDGRVIASLLSFVAGHTAHSWKICYDEAQAKQSPGVLVEIVNLRRLHERRQIAWMDSGATPDHSMINALWPDRKRIETRWLSTGGRGAALVVSALPFAVRLKTWVRAR